MSERVATARHGLVRAIRMIRRRPTLPLKTVNGARTPLCAAPGRRGFDPGGPVDACPAMARSCYRIERLIVPLCTRHARAAERAGEVLFVEAAPGICRVCGCTAEDCSGCVERTGDACTWVEKDLCSACVPGKDKS